MPDCEAEERGRESQHDDPRVRFSNAVSLLALTMPRGSSHSGQSGQAGGNSRAWQVPVEMQWKVANAQAITKTTEGATI